MNWIVKGFGQMSNQKGNKKCFINVWLLGETSECQAAGNAEQAVDEG